MFTHKLIQQPKSVRQTDFSAGKGNALQACIAAMFGLDLEEVPNFIALEIGYQRGIEEFVSPLTIRKIDLLAQGNSLLSTDFGKICILRGKSPRGSHAHVVVARILERNKFEFLVDPHPDDTFLDQAEPFGWCMLIE